MPQLAPMSWLLVPFVFLLCIFLVLVSMWWISFSFFSFVTYGDSVSDDLDLGLHLWSW